MQVAVDLVQTGSELLSAPGQVWKRELPGL